jgi:hypothetical protein
MLPGHLLFRYPNLAQSDAPRQVSTPGRAHQRHAYHQRVTKSQLGQPEIERIIAGDLTRGQIVAEFQVGEHAAQLARTQAKAVIAERQRTTSAAPSSKGRDIEQLRAAAEEYLEWRLSVAGLSLGTDRTKIVQFLDWLAEQEQ